MGGKVKGGQVLGEFPSDAFDFKSKYNIGHGRMVPTMPWDGVWYPLAKWMGVEEAQIPAMLPNAKNFVKGKSLLTEAQTHSK